jgi:hypothetical protein
MNNVFMASAVATIRHALPLPSSPTALLYSAKNLVPISADKRQQRLDVDEAPPTDFVRQQLLVSYPLVDRGAAETGCLGCLANGANRPLGKGNFV